jgi:hypothetical protein
MSYHHHHHHHVSYHTCSLVALTDLLASRKDAISPTRPIQLRRLTERLRPQPRYPS